MTQTQSAAAALFDLGGVIVRQDYEGAAKMLGLDERTLLNAIFGGNDRTVLIGALTEDDWWGVIQGRLDLNDEHLRELRLHLEQHVKVDEAMMAHLRMLKGRVPLGCVANGGGQAWASRFRLRPNR